jgi:two-component system, cell cycle sensor histidine kinase and response regulator CckA
VHRRQADIPVIIVSGSIGEEQAVRAMQEGAFDYLIKDRLARLPKAVERALAHRQLQQAHRDAERMNARLVSMIEGSPDLAAITGPDGRLIFLNAAGRRLAGVSAGQDLGKIALQDILPPEITAVMSGSPFDPEAGQRVRRGETRLVTPGGRRQPPIP